MCACGCMCMGAKGQDICIGTGAVNLSDASGNNITTRVEKWGAGGLSPLVLSHAHNIIVSVCVSVLK